MISEQYIPLNEIKQSLDGLHSLDHKTLYTLRDQIFDPFDLVEFYSTILERNARGELALKNGLALAVIQGIKESSGLCKELSTIDSLTGMHNKGALDEIIDGCISRAERGIYTELNLVFAFCDMNKFKIVNDTYGHTTGDNVINYVAEGIKKYTRPTDHTVRFGGDEFIIIFDAVRKTIKLEEWLIRKNLGINNYIGEQVKTFHSGKEIDTGISIGASVFGVDAFNKTEWIKHADDALYYAKKNAQLVGEPPVNINVHIYDSGRKELYLEE